jgi:DNA-binding HxlR family transcriptional regulator
MNGQSTGNGRTRAGTAALSLLSAPLNVHVLQALEGGPLALIDLRRAVGSPPETTMRGNLRTLTSLGTLARTQQDDFPGAVDYELASAGEDLLGVGHVLQDWLAACPVGPLQLGSPAAKSTLKALSAGWNSTMVRALAARPLSLTELNKLISGLNYPSLERRLGALRLAGLVDRCPGQGRSTPYAVTKWLRCGIGPLAAAAMWERRHAPTAAAPIGRIDIEAAFLLTVPILELPEDLSGSCRLAVEVRGASEQVGLAGVVMKVEQGRIVSCVARLEGDATASASGTAAAWMRSLAEGEPDDLEVAGDPELACGVVESLHRVLFGGRERV